MSASLAETTKHVGSLGEVATIMRQQLNMQQQMMEQQMDLQRKHLQQQIWEQQQHMEKQLALISAVAKLPLGGCRPGQEPLVTDMDRAVPPRPPEKHEYQQSEAANVKVVVAKDPSPGEKKADLDEAMKHAKGRLETWQRCSGLHTIKNWVTNYRKHPAGWGALLMIHGIPEVEKRLRQKVQNYAVFSALFLAGSIKSMSGKIPVCNPDPDTLECHIRKRVFTYFFSLAIASLILCILLAMAFHNALNEAARDSDVFRMFARGKGFVATWRCQTAFRVGAASVCVGLTAVAQESIGWEMVVWSAILVAMVLMIYKQTSERLYRNGSIIGYWREELGGKPDPADPYDLKVPVDLFLKRAEAEYTVRGEDDALVSSLTPKSSKLEDGAEVVVSS